MGLAMLFYTSYMTPDFHCCCHLVAGFVVSSLCIMPPRCFKDSCRKASNPWNRNTKAHQGFFGC
jgi:hypothetical protein